MAIHERLTSLRATEVHTDVLYVGEVRHTNLSPEAPEATPLVEAPASLPEKLSLVALARAYEDLREALISAGVLAPHTSADEAGEPA